MGGRANGFSPSELKVGWLVAVISKFIFIALSKKPWGNRV